MDEQKQNIINKLSYINIITSLDTFICDIILTKIIQDEESFNNFFNSIPPCKKKDEMTKLKEDNLVAQWEQKVIEYVMRTSYSNIDTIKDILKELFKVSIIDTNGKMLLPISICAHHGLMDGRDVAEFLQNIEYHQNLL